LENSSQNLDTTNSIEYATFPSTARHSHAVEEVLSSAATHTLCDETIGMSQA